MYIYSIPYISGREAKLRFSYPTPLPKELRTRSDKTTKEKHNMIELTKQEKELLVAIVNDKYSVGAFTGMVFNSINSSPNPSKDTIKQAIKDALNVRLVAMELAQ